MAVIRKPMTSEVGETDTAPTPGNLIAFCDEEPKALWSAIAEHCPVLKINDKNVPWGRQVLENGLKGHVKSAVLENDYICKDHRNLHSNFLSKKFHSNSGHCMRLHFFDKDIFASGGDGDPIEVLLSRTDINDAYIGYSVIRPGGRRVLGRTVLNPAKIGRGVENGYFALSAKFSVHIAGRQLDLVGFPWMSQDTEALVCAHATLWGVCRYLSQRYNVYKETYPYDFIKVTSTNLGRTVPYRGMNWSDYSEILSGFGCHPLVLREVNTAADGFQEVYSYIESGFPVLASTGSHVLTLIGHTLKRDRTPLVKGGLIDTSCFVDSLIVADDNALPYQRLKWESPDDEYGAIYRKKDSNGNPDRSTDLTIRDIKNCVVPLAEKVFLPARFARIALIRLLETFAANEPVIKELLAREQLVVRQFVTSGAAIKTAARERFLSTGARLFTRLVQLPLPHFVWVMELSSLEGYRANACVGEIVVDATANEHDIVAPLFMRIQAKLVVGVNYEEEEGETPNLQALPLFSNNLGARKPAS
jgi:hypothetical protein